MGIKDDSGTIGSVEAGRPGAESGMRTVEESWALARVGARQTTLVPTG
jgi:hypothetical protein